MFGVTFERVMFFAIQVPVSTSLNHSIQVNITGLDGQPFYPGIYMNQYQSSEAVTDFSGLAFANV